MIIWFMNCHSTSKVWPVYVTHCSILGIGPTPASSGKRHDMRALLAAQPASIPEQPDHECMNSGSCSSS